MKFLTLEVYHSTGEDSVQWDRLYRPALAAYKEHIEHLGDKLPPELRAIADPFYVDDVLVSKLWQKSKGDPLVLVLRRGNLQIGYSDLELTYVDPEITTEHLAILVEIARTHRGNRWYEMAEGDWHEVDVLPDGRFEHRLLFHSGVWFGIRCRELRVRETPKPNRRLAPYIHRVRLPIDPEELRKHLPGWAASKIHDSYWGDKSWMAPILERDGFIIAEHALRWEDLEPVRRALTSYGPLAGVRGILGIPEVAALVASERVRALVEPVLGQGARAVRGIFFDKTPNANWKVPWHQDLTIAVRERHEVEGFGPWSVKGGIPHVQPPASVLQNMLTVCIHLDDCDADNGALKVILGSHRHGRLSPEEIDRLAKSPHTVCDVNAGDALLMRPLLLHASSPAVSPRHRRVVHIEFANIELAVPLQWTDGRDLA